MECVRVGVLAGHKVVGGAERGLHHAARHAEDVSGARRYAERAVEVLFFQKVHVYEALAKLARELADREHGIHVRAGAGGVHAGVGGLHLLGDARHIGHNEDLCGVHAEDLGIVRLGERAEDLLRALRGGELLRQLGVARLREAHPAGAA